MKKPALGWLICSLLFINGSDNHHFYGHGGSPYYPNHLHVHMQDYKQK